MLRLREEKTLWVFLLPVSNSADNPEERHIYDVVFGVYCIQQAGISPDDIVVIIDGKDRAKISRMMVDGTGNAYEVLTLEQFDKVKERGSSVNDFVLFVFGHGHQRGLASRIPISPYTLINSIGQIRNITNAIVYLGPCYTGVFNYMPVSRQTSEELACDMILVGATQFHSSIATSTTENMFGNREVSWVADIFLWSVFNWFRCPVDIDGDGCCTIMDSFKYAGLQTNITYQNIKIRNFSRIISEVPAIDHRLAKIKKKYQVQVALNKRLPEKSRLKSFSDQRIADLGAQYSQQDRNRKELLEISMFNQQEPWILNSIPAQRIEF